MHNEGDLIKGTSKANVAMDIPTVKLDFPQSPLGVV